MGLEKLRTLEFQRSHLFNFYVCDEQYKELLNISTKKVDLVFNNGKIYFYPTFACLTPKYKYLTMLYELSRYRNAYILEILTYEDDVRYCETFYKCGFLEVPTITFDASQIYVEDLRCTIKGD